MAWSLSFYPQPMLNLRRKSTSGLAIDFSLLNVLGFACYTASTTAFFLVPTIRRQYATRHPLSPEPTVRFNDFAFALHGLVLCIVTYTQFWKPIWGFSDTESRRASNVALGIFWGSMTAISIITLMALSHTRNTNDTQSWAAIDVVSQDTFA